MGGHISRDKLMCSETGQPNVLYDVLINAETSIYGSSLPVTNAQLLQLQIDHNVDLIVTLLLRPLQAGRNVNHSYGDTNDPEWHDADPNLFENITMKRLHIPVQDNYPPTMENFLKFCREVKATLDNNKSVLVHCWGGKSLTATMIIGYLMYVDNMSFDDAFDHVPVKKLSRYQLEYLMDPSFPVNPHESDQPELVIKTDSKASCYTSPTDNI